MTETLHHPGCPMSPVVRHRLPTGLRLLIKEAHTTPIAAVYFWCAAGSVNEPPELNGISHFFEHMFFKGTEKRGPLQMDREIKSLGGYNNAFTSVEYTAYYVVVPSKHFALAFDILLDAIRNSVFAAEEIERERQVILEEIKRKEDTPGACLQDLFQSKVFEGTPYAQPVLGTPESLSHLHREQFHAYLRAYYRPENLCVVVAGDVSPESVIQKVGESTADWQAGNGPGPGRPPFSKPQPGIQTHVKRKDVNQIYWVLGHVTDGRAQRRVGYVLDLLSTVLSGGRSSRLYQRLVERENLVTHVDAWHWTLDHAGLFGVDSEFPLNNLEGVKKAIFEELERARQQPVKPEELERAKTRITSGFAFGSETVANIAMTLGRHEILTKAEDALQYVETIRSVSADEMLSVAREQLNPASYTLCQIEPGAE